MDAANAKAQKIIMMVKAFLNHKGISLSRKPEIYPSTIVFWTNKEVDMATVETLRSDARAGVFGLEFHTEKDSEED